MNVIMKLLCIFLLTSMSGNALIFTASAQNKLLQQKTEQVFKAIDKAVASGKQIVRRYSPKHKRLSYRLGTITSQRSKNATDFVDFKVLINDVVARCNPYWVHSYLEAQYQLQAFDRRSSPLSRFLASLC